PTITKKKGSLEVLLEKSLEQHIEKITDPLYQKRLQAQNNIHRAQQ
ncbi:30069_t:CDS:1, partial [Racocetra persica]